jgi:hypothetical protein
MKMRRRLITWGYVIAAGWFLAITHARGSTIDYASAAKADETKYRTPEDMIDMVPFLSSIPRTFLFGDGYKVKLTADQMRIDHMGQDSRSNGSQRTCMLGVSYTAPVAFFTTRIDMPIFHSPTLALSDWSRDSLGDYVVYMSRLPAAHTALTLTLSARF